MKSLKPWLAVLTAGALLSAGNLLAQNMPAPPASSMSPPPTSPVPDSANYPTPEGELTVRSAPSPAPQIGPAPAFEQLSGGTKAITEDQAAAYPPLANDFIHADSNRNGSVNQSEYTHWIKQL